MKKILLFILTFLSTIFLVACGDLFNPVEDLTNEEKIAILEEIKFSADTKYSLETNVQLSVTEHEETNTINSSIKLYTDLSSKEDFVAFLEYDFTLSAEEMSASAKGMAYANATDAYLDIDLNLDMGIMQTTIKTKEVMAYGEFFDIKEFIDGFLASLENGGSDDLDDLDDWDDWDDFDDFDDWGSYLPEDIDFEALDELLQYLDFKATKDGYKVSMTLNKEKINSIEAFKDIPEYGDELDKLNDKSYLKLEFTIKDNEITKISLDCDIKIEDEEFSFILKFDFSFEVGKKAPTLPKASVLTEFDEVETFSILENFPFKN